MYLPMHARVGKSLTSRVKVFSTVYTRKAHGGAEQVSINQYVVVDKPEGRNLCHCWYVWSGVGINPPIADFVEVHTRRMTKEA